MAESLTDKLKLSKRDTGDINWGQGANANLDAVDTHAQQATLRPPRTLSASLGSGAVGANLSGSATYFYKITAVNAVGETTEGKIPVVLEAQITESAGPVPVLLSWETVNGATGYKIYKSTSSGQEKFLALVSGESTAIYTDDGNTATNGGISVPATNTARTSVSKIVAGTNVTISPVDGTGDVTVNATSSAPADASDTVKGVTKLSLAPAVAANPIAVGDNDSRNTNARTPSGAAGGDLSGTYPNPAVAKVNGTSVPASPSAGQVLTATGPTAAAWQAPSGSYAATVVVAAPSGAAATDTTNVTTALTAAASAGGGKVLLREGTYLINSALTIGANVILMGQGKSATVVQATTSVGATPFIAMTSSRGALRDLTVDFNTSARGRIAAFDMNITGANVVVDSVALINNAASNLTRMIKIQPTTAAQFVTFSKCDITFGDGTTLFSMAQVQFAVFDSCFFNMLSKGNSQVWFEDISGSGFLVIKSCTFSINIGVAQTSLVQWGGSSTGPLIFTNNKIDILSGSITNTVQVLSASTVVTVSDNTAVSTSAGGIVGLAKTTVCGNNGFSSYSGGIQVGNDLGTINAVIVSTTAPTTGQVLTATGAAAAAWQTPAGGGGYATVVVAAPTGVAATDTANIQNAINSIGSGTVILREGLYVVNTTITLKSRIAIRGQGKGEYGSGAPTTLKCDNAMGDVPLFDTFSLAPLDVSLEDFSIDINAFSRAARTGTYDIRLSGIRPRLLRIAIANSSVHINVSSNNINEPDSPSVDDCVFVQGKLTSGSWASLQGKIRNCLFVGETASAGLQNGLVAFAQATTVVGCVFRTNQDYTTGVIGSTVALDTAASNGRAGISMHGCIFIQESGTATRAIQVNDTGSGAISIIGNYSSTGTNVGSISVRNGGGTGLVTISGNAGFASYSGGTLSGNDGQTPINSGGAAGGDLSGTYPNPTVAKVNGTSVPAAPSAGQVLTASGPTAATWETPAGGTPGWTQIFSEILGADTFQFSQVTIDASRKLWRMVFIVRQGSITNTTLQLLVNEDTVASNYHNVKMEAIGGAAGPTISAEIASPDICQWNSAGRIVADILVGCDPSVPDVFAVVRAMRWDETANKMALEERSWRWRVFAGPPTSFRIRAATGSGNFVIAAGSTLKVFQAS